MQLHADILVSDDLENWTKVVTIGDGNENTNDAGVDRKSVV